MNEASPIQVAETRLDPSPASAADGDGAAIRHGEAAGFYLAVGLGAGDVDYRPKGIFRQVAIRGNVVRHVDNELDWPGMTSGFDVDNGGVVLLSHNVFAIDQASPIQFHWCELVSCVNNRTVQGTLVCAFDKVTNRSAELYFPAAEDAMVLAML